VSVWSLRRRRTSTKGRKDAASRLMKKTAGNGKNGNKGKKRSRGRAKENDREDRKGNDMLSERGLGGNTRDSLRKKEWRRNSHKRGKED